MTHVLASVCTYGRGLGQCITVSTKQPWSVTQLAVLPMLPMLLINCNRPSGNRWPATYHGASVAKGCSHSYTYSCCYHIVYILIYTCVAYNCKPLRVCKHIVIHWHLCVILTCIGGEEKLDDRIVQIDSLSWLKTDNNKNCSTSNILEMKKGKALANCNLMEQS